MKCVHLLSCVLAPNVWQQLFAIDHRKAGSHGGAARPGCSGATVGYTSSLRHIAREAGVLGHATFHTDVIASKSSENSVKSLASTPHIFQAHHTSHRHSNAYNSWWGSAICQAPMRGGAISHRQQQAVEMLARPPLAPHFCGDPTSCNNIFVQTGGHRFVRVYIMRKGSSPLCVSHVGRNGFLKPRQAYHEKPYALFFSHRWPS